MFLLKITNAGLNAALSAIGLGNQIQIDRVGIGDGHYEPTGDETDLANETQSLSINLAIISNDTQINVTTTDLSDSAYDVNEIGIFLDDGTLFAIWSDPTQSLTSKEQGIELIIKMTLQLSGVGSDNVTVNIEGGISNTPIGIATNDIPGLVQLGLHVPAVLNRTNDWRVDTLLTENNLDLLTFKSLDDALDYAETITLSYNRPITIRLEAGNFALSKSRSHLKNEVLIIGQEQPGWFTSADFSGSTDSVRTALANKFTTIINIENSIKMRGNIPSFQNVLFQNPTVLNGSPNTGFRHIEFENINQKVLLNSVAIDSVALSFTHCHTYIQEFVYLISFSNNRISINSSNIAFQQSNTRESFYIGTSRVLLAIQSTVSLRRQTFMNNNTSPIIVASNASKMLVDQHTQFISISGITLRARQGSQVIIDSPTFNHNVEPNFGTQGVSGAMVSLGRD